MMKMVNSETGKDVAPAAMQTGNTTGDIQNKGEGDMDCTTKTPDTASSCVDGGDATVTWAELVQQKLNVSSCTKSNTPPPNELVYQTLALLLQRLPSFKDMNARKAVAVLAEHRVLVPYADLQQPNSNDPSKSSDDGEQLRVLQVQGMARLLLWSSLGEPGVVAYAKWSKRMASSKGKKRRRKNKLDQPKDALFQDTCQILSLATLQLAPGQQVGDFLKDCCCCLPASSSSSSFDSKLPADTVQRLFDFFEVPNPFRSRKETAAMEASSVLAPARRTAASKKRKAAAAVAAASKQVAAVAAPTDASVTSGSVQTNDSTSKASSNKASSLKNKSRSDSFSSSVALTRPMARPKNSLLAKDGNLTRSRFVGSHFNSSLSNASALFRQVKGADRRQHLLQAAASKKAKTATASNNGNNKSLLLNAKKRPVAGNKRPSSATSLRQSVPAASNSRRIVQETPAFKKSRPRFAHGGSSSSIVMETPRQPERNNSRIYHAAEQQPAAAAQSNANLVAQAFRAVQQRKR